MNTATVSFYVTGGTLRHDAPSYVERQADRALLEGLSRGEFCYVLTARQMGKSSLMIHTAARLRDEGITVILLDLQRVGRNLSVEQWYDGLLELVGQQLALEDEIDDFWLDHGRLGPLQRWFSALREVVLARVPGRLVLFVDEIDTVQSLPFSTDEFFAGIRDCYNRRTEDPEFERLTFCLLGVAAPSDLIRDERTTPFNIGRRIELADFARAEAAALAAGLRRKKRRATTLLLRVLHWTGGHPYLTQRLCRAVAEDGSVAAVEGVDRLCQELFLAPRARERDDNLLFVRDRLSRHGEDAGPLLRLYARVRSPRQRVPDDETNPLVTALRLSGAVREVEGNLEVRNRIYRQVFDSAWVVANMPAAELRRLRAVAREEARKRRTAEDRERTVRRLLYVAQMNLAQQAWESGDVTRTQELLEAQRPEPGQEDLRGFEWRYLWRLCQEGEALATLCEYDATIRRVAFSPDGGTVVLGGEDGVVRLLDLATVREVAALTGHSAAVGSIAFSFGGAYLITGSPSEIILWDLDRRQRRVTLDARLGGVTCLALSADAGRMAIGHVDGSLALCAVGPARPAGWPERVKAAWETGRKEYLEGHTLQVDCVAFSPDGKFLATGSTDMSARLWDAESGEELAAFTGYPGAVFGLAFSPNGELLATASYDSNVKVWDVGKRTLVAALKGHRSLTSAVAFAPAGRWLASLGDDTVRLWDVAAGWESRTLRGHTEQVRGVAFSPDSSMLATAGEDGTVKLWDPSGRRESDLLPVVSGSLAFSSDGRLLATAGGTTIQLWEFPSLRERARLDGHRQGISCLVFAPDGRSLLSASGAWNEPERPGELRIWDVGTAGERARLSDQERAIYAASFSPDGRLFAIRRSDGIVTVWDSVTHEVVRTWQARAVEGLAWWAAVAFSPDGKVLASGAVDSGAVTLWSVATGQKVADLTAPIGGVPGLAFSPNARTLAAGSLNGTVALWDVATRQVRALLREVGGVISALAFSSDGRRVAAGYHDATVRLWDVLTGQAVATLHGHDKPVSAVVFSPDGDVLVTASGDPEVRLWRTDSFVETDGPASAP